MRSACTVWVSLAILTLKSPVDINVPTRSTLNLEKKKTIPLFHVLQIWITKTVNTNFQHYIPSFHVLQIWITKTVNTNFQHYILQPLINHHVKHWPADSHSLPCCPKQNSSHSKYFGKNTSPHNTTTALIIDVVISNNIRWMSIKSNERMSIITITCDRV